DPDLRERLAPHLSRRRVWRVGVPEAPRRPADHARRAGFEPSGHPRGARVHRGARAPAIRRRAQLRGRSRCAALAAQRTRRAGARRRAAARGTEKNVAAARLPYRIAGVRILVSNDDGYFSPGITLLAEALGRLGEVTVVAPERDRSGASNSLTLDRPLSVRRAPNGFFSVNGTPTDCVHIAVTGVLDFTPDLVVSGINLGANMGDDPIYSGPVAAAAEGFLLGIPALAISLASKAGEHFESAIGVALELVERLRRAPPREPVLYNVNVP